MKTKIFTLKFKDNQKQFSLGFKNNEITIGSGPSDYIKLREPGVDPMHVRLAYTYTGVYIIVTGASGCIVGNDRYERDTAVLLTNRARFDIGGVSFTLNEEKFSNRLLNEVMATDAGHIETNYETITLSYRDRFSTFTLGTRNNDITIGSGSTDYIELIGPGVQPMHIRLVATICGVYIIVSGETGCTLENATERFMKSGSACLLLGPTKFRIGVVSFLYEPNDMGQFHILHEPENRQSYRDSLRASILGTEDHPITLGLDNPSPTPVSSGARSSQATVTEPIVVPISPALNLPNPSNDSNTSNDSNPSNDSNLVLASLPAALPPSSTPPSTSTSAQSDSWFNHESISCSICLDIMQNATSVVPCMHKFCNTCIIRWMGTKKTCPRCRQGITKAALDPDFSAICSDYVTAKGYVFASPASPVHPSNGLVTVRQAHRSIDHTGNTIRAIRARARTRRRIGFLL